MTPETYYTVRSIQSPCGSGAPALVELTYRRFGARNPATKVNGVTFW